MNLFSIPNFPLVKPGDDLAALILEKLAEIGETLRPTDVVVIAQKIVSKADDRLVRLADIVPDNRAFEIAERTGKDPRVVQVVLDDSSEVIRILPGLLITAHQSGWICANAGVDRSNVEPTSQPQKNFAPDVALTDANSHNRADDTKAGEGRSAGHSDDQSNIVALLPVDSDASAAQIRQRLADLSGVSIDKTAAVLINDSHGRAWRIGTVGVCIGCAGMPPIWDQRGLFDLFGYELKGSEECIADELCAAASLLMGQSDEGNPVVIVRGYPMPQHPPAPAKTIQRPADKDAFR